MILRTLEENDLSFIYASYLKSLRPHKSSIANDVYYPNEHKIMESLLLNALTVVLVDNEDSNLIVGWASATIVPELRLVLNYCYIKRRYRKLGYASKLIDTIIEHADEDLPRFCSCHTPSFIRLSSKYRLIYNPYLISLGELP